MNWKIKIAPFIALILFVPTGCNNPPETVSSNQTDSTTLNLLLQSPSHTVFSQQKTVVFGDTTRAGEMIIKGFIVPDERRTNIFSARFNGRIEKLYVRFPYQFVNKGDKLADVYSEELSTALNEHLLLYGSDSSSNMTQQSRTRLGLLGITPDQIRSIENKNTVPAFVTIYSPYDGYSLPVRNEGGPVASASPSMGSMNGMTGKQTNQSVTSSLYIREGGYFTEGQTLFSFNDARTIAAELSFPAGSASITVGARLEIVNESDGSIHTGKIFQLVPDLAPGQKFVTAKVELTNSMSELKFNSLVSASVTAENSTATMLPSSCVLDLGKRKIVWIKSGAAGKANVFVPRIVTTRAAENSRLEILSGLSAGDEVALEAGLMVDREGIIISEQK